VVTGTGPGPNLLQPVPFAMARRQGGGAQFFSLLEPYGEARRVRTFRLGSAESFTVAGDLFDDRISFDAGGALRCLGRQDGAIARMGLAGAAALDDGFTSLLKLSRPASVEVDFSEGGAAAALSGAVAGTFRIYAPAARKLLVNGQPSEARRDGDILVYTAP
jgi:hypothetical protein